MGVEAGGDEGRSEKFRGLVAHNLPAACAQFARTQQCCLLLARGLLPVSIAQDAPARIGTMHIEAVRKDASPSRTGLVQDYMKIECPQCWVAYHLYHDGLEVKLLRGIFCEPVGRLAVSILNTIRS